MILRKLDSPSTPGPGDYAIPSVFDNYKRSSLKFEQEKSRMNVIIGLGVHSKSLSKESRIKHSIEE